MKQPKHDKKDTTKHNINFIKLSTDSSSRTRTRCTFKTQRAHGVKMTLYQRRCDVMTSHRRRSDVILTPCACWESIQFVMLCLRFTSILFLIYADLVKAPISRSQIKILVIMPLWILNKMPVVLLNINMWDMVESGVPSGAR